MITENNFTIVCYSKLEETQIHETVRKAAQSSGIVIGSPTFKNGVFLEWMGQDRYKVLIQGGQADPSKAHLLCVQLIKEKEFSQVQLKHCNYS